MNPPPVEILLPLLKHNDPHVRANVLRAFGEMGGLEDHRLLEPIVAAMDDEDAAVRANAARALAELGAVPTRSVVERLVVAWKDRRSTSGNTPSRSRRINLDFYVVGTNLDVSAEIAKLDVVFARRNRS